MPKIFLIKNRLHQQQQRLLESQNLLQHKSQDDERCLVPPLSPSPSGSGSGSGSAPSPPPHPHPSQPEPQGQAEKQPNQDQQPLSLTRKRFHHRRHYFGQSRHSLPDNGTPTQNQNQNSTELEVDGSSAGQVQNGKFIYPKKKLKEVLKKRNIWEEENIRLGSQSPLFKNLFKNCSEKI